MDCIDYLDPITEERRPFTGEDCRITATIADALPNFTWVMTIGMAADAPAYIADRVNARQVLTYCEKPFVFCCKDVNSVLAGASAAGSRSYTASSSQGLLLMAEVLYASAGMRQPFVITGVNRSISAPINIQVDHQDTMSLRDAGLIQFYVESSQEAYDLHLAEFKIAEAPNIMLPVMVCMDGWVLTHSYERVEFVDQEAVDIFLPPFKPEHDLDHENLGLLCRI